jgi:hypothetical protein
VNSRLRFKHAQQCFDTPKWDYDMHEWDYVMHECDLYTNELNFNTMRVILTRTNKKFWIGLWLAAIPHTRLSFWHPACDLRTLRVIFTPCVWFSHPACDFGTMCVIWTLMRVILTLYVLNYFNTIYREKG